jgi:hypothetical protein
LKWQDYSQARKKADEDEINSSSSAQDRLRLLHSIVYPVGAFRICAICAAIEIASNLYAVTDDPAATMFTGWG